MLEKILLKILILITSVSFNSISYTVSATVYYAVPSQTNDDNSHTASMYKLDLNNPYKHRIIAVSRDLINKGLDFGDKVYVTGTGKYDGVWVVNDLMNKRFKSKIDFLINEDMGLGKWENITIVKID